MLAKLKPELGDISPPRRFQGLLPWAFWLELFWELFPGFGFVCSLDSPP